MRTFAIRAWLFLFCLIPFAPAFAQQGVCKPGVNCSANSISLTSNVQAFAVNLGAKLCLAGTSNCSTRYAASSATNLFAFSNMNVQTNNAFISTASSGSNGVQFSTTGARLDMGAGASDYLYSDGTNVCAGNGQCLSATNLPTQVLGSKDYDFPSIAAGGYADVTVTVNGTVSLGDQCIVAGGAAYPAGFIVSCFVNDLGTVTIRAICSNAGTACDAVTQTWFVRVFRN